MSETVVIRTRRTTRAQLQDLAREDGTSAIDALDRLVREATETRLLRAVTDDLSSLPDPTETMDIASWDATLADGLDRGEDFSAWR